MKTSTNRELCSISERNENLMSFDGDDIPDETRYVPKKYEGGGSDDPFESYSPVKSPDLKKRKKVRRYEGGQRQQPIDPRFTKGELLRENTKKTGLKSFKEDKKSVKKSSSKNASREYEKGSKNTKKSQGDQKVKKDRDTSRGTSQKIEPGDGPEQVMSSHDEDRDEIQKKYESSVSNKSSTDQDLDYEQSKEYLKKQDILYRSRLSRARIWLMIVTLYYVFRCIFVIFPKFEMRDSFTQNMIIIQLIGMGVTVVGIIVSFPFNIKIIIPLFYIQASQMALSNFNGYVAENTINFEGLNMLSTVFSVLIAVFNCFLASLVIESYYIKALCTFFVFILLEATIIWTNFIFGDITYHTMVSLTISIVFTVIMIPAFGYISSAIQNESIQEAKLSYQQRDGYRRMFDGLQEGIIVLDNDRLNFMNDLSNKLLSELSDMRNFFKNKCHSGAVSKVDPLDIKLFYLFEHDKSETNKTSKKRKYGSQSDHSKHSTEQSKQVQIEYSLREIAALSTKELTSKIFTFDKKLAYQDLTKMVGQSKNLDSIIKGLPSMKGIDEEFIPKFKFLQIKKSMIKSFIKGQEKTMICFIDISQKILYDTSKAEGEFLSLINSTISHEMRNPLNSIINQCKIVYSVCLGFKKLMTNYSDYIDPQVLEQLEEIHKQVYKGNEIQTSSSNLLLLNVEDILGFAQLKAGKFTKIIKKFNLKRCIEDIISIQYYQAQSKKILLTSKFIDFPLKKTKEIPNGTSNLLVESDEKRIKQVLINLQSNALKFTKEGGKIHIECQYIPSKRTDPNRKIKKVHDSFSSEKSSKSGSESNISENSKFSQEHSVDTLFEQDEVRDKIVIQVIDSGIGIKKKDKVKLFKLFGCLQNTKQMNTQGIGLGLVISENIVKAFGGRIGVKSKYGKGTKFAFSILLGKDDDFVDIMNDEVVLQQPSNRSMDRVTSSNASVKPNQVAPAQNESDHIALGFENENDFHRSSEASNQIIDMPDEMMSTRMQVYNSFNCQTQNQTLRRINSKAQAIVNFNNVYVNKDISIPYITSNIDSGDERTSGKKQGKKAYFNTHMNTFSANTAIMNAPTKLSLLQSHTFALGVNKQMPLMNIGKILIVDDEKFNCDIIEGFLMILGFDQRSSLTEFAYNGEQAVKKVRDAIEMNDPYKFSLILMDCNMPFLDGYEATKKIRKLFLSEDIQREQQPKIVAITGHVESEYIQKAISSGMDKVYPKPLPIKEFGQLLMQMSYISEVPEHLRLDSDQEDL